MEKTLQDRIQELLWEAAELQAQSFTERLKVDLADQVPTDAATLNALTASLKLHGVHLGNDKDTQDTDPVSRQREALARLQELRGRLRTPRGPQVMDEDAIAQILQ